MQAVLENDTVWTVATIRPVEVFKGSLLGETMKLRIPGGFAEGQMLWIPGAPKLAVSDTVILFAIPAPEFPGEFCLNEFGLSHFAIVEDEAGSHFAIRPAFYKKDEPLFVDANLDETVRDGRAN